MHIHPGPDFIEDFLAGLADLSLNKEAKSINTREVVDNQVKCCHGDNNLRISSSGCELKI